mgnify:FL=1
MIRKDVVLKHFVKLPNKYFREIQNLITRKNICFIFTRPIFYLLLYKSCKQQVKEEEIYILYKEKRLR